MSNKSITLPILLLLAFFFGCAEDSERQFKSIACELKDELVPLEKIKPAIYEAEANNKDIITLDLTEKAAFLDKNRSKFNSIANELDVFSSLNKESIWGDDSAFLLVMEYLSISIPGNDYHLETIEKINLFLKEYPDFEIENWTKNYFKNITLFYILDKSKISDADLFGHERLELAVNERIEAFLLSSLVFEHLKGGDVKGAEKKFEKISSDSKYEWLNESLRDAINTYKIQVESTKNSEGAK
jgi:hypothetical protein